MYRSNRPATANICIKYYLTVNNKIIYVQGKTVTYILDPFSARYVIFKQYKYFIMELRGYSKGALDKFLLNQNLGNIEKSFQQGQY